MYTIQVLIFKNPFQKSNDIKNRRYRLPLTNDDNNLNITEGKYFIVLKKRMSQY